MLASQKDKKHNVLPGGVQGRYSSLLLSAKRTRCGGKAAAPAEREKRQKDEGTEKEGANRSRGGQRHTDSDG